MNNRDRGVIRRLTTLAAGVMAFGSLAACSTTTSVATGATAPVTYKVAKIEQGAHTPRQIRAPRTVEPRVNPPLSQAKGPKFDKKSVDKTLYKHQKVGKRYTVMGKSYSPKHQPNYNTVGTASWYGDKFHGRPTATGEVFNKNDLTAAHKTLPLNSMLHVTNLENGRTLMVRLNDRGPFIGDRVIDLSEAAAKVLGTKENGLAKVRIRYAGPADPNHPRKMYKAKPRKQVKPKKVAPRKPAPKYDDLIAQAPKKPKYVAPKPTYKPLRKQSDAMPYLPPVAEAAPITPAAPKYTPATPKYKAPAPQRPVFKAPVKKAPAIPAPSAEAMGPEVPLENGGTVTMTIKGPIHMASTKSGDKKARLIPAVHITEVKDEK